MNIIPKLKIALCQLNVNIDKHLNILNTSNYLKNTFYKTNSNLIILPECWNCPYSTLLFSQYAEIIPNLNEHIDSNLSPSISMLSLNAKELGIWLIGGSIPEKVINNELNGKEEIYNTCVVINPEGNIVAKHRKVHLFDIDVPGKITFKESDSLTGGSNVTVVDTPWGGIGVGICYDIRFPELAGIMRQRGATILVYPGAFNMVTGPAHWQLLQRARAVDNQVFVAACSPARNPDSSYVAWGHSSIISPWGDVLVEAQEGEEVVSAEIDLNIAAEMRQNIPCWKQKRNDIYQLNDLLKETNSSI